MCNRCGGKSKSSNLCPALNKKFHTCEKVGNFAKICKGKTQPNSGKSDQHNNFCDEEGNLSGQTTSEIEMETYYTQKHMFNMSTTCDFITVKDQKIDFQVHNGANSTVISPFFWTELGRHQLGGKIRRHEAYDDHQLTPVLSLTCDVRNE